MGVMSLSDSLRRFLQPKSIAIAGGTDAAEVVRQCKLSGFSGEIWAINPKRQTLEGIQCYPDVASLPGTPDACFLAVSREQTVKLVAQLATRGAGGAVCYASGFAEVGEEGVVLQKQLLDAASGMAILGPNCYGIVNMLDGCALWPDRVGGGRVNRGVAILTQSGNIGLNLSMQAHHLPIAYLAALGNMAQVNFHQMIDALIDDERVSVISLHIEGLSDISAFSEIALKALKKGKPIVALKTGASQLGAKLAASHTSSLAGADQLCNALFQRVGIARAYDLPEFLEALKFLHVCGPLKSNTVASMSCSGGEASLIADLGEQCNLVFPEIDHRAQLALCNALGPKVPLANPLDYHTYIWGDAERLTLAFEAMLSTQTAVGLLALDFPNVGLKPQEPLAWGWKESLDGFIAAHGRSTKAAMVVSSMAELMPKEAAELLLSAGIAPMQGFKDSLNAISLAAFIGKCASEANQRAPVVPTEALLGTRSVQLTEVQAKLELAEFGVPIPPGRVVRSTDEALRAAKVIGYPVVVKGVSDRLAHKSELGAVKININTDEGVCVALSTMRQADVGLDTWLVEKMEANSLAELIVGVVRDPQFGLTLTLGAGGVMVELLNDAKTLLMPASRTDIETAIRGLRIFALLDGYRGKPKADLAALIDAIEAIVKYAQTHSADLIELDVNPVLVFPNGVVAVDALVRRMEFGEPDRNTVTTSYHESHRITASA